MGGGRENQDVEEGYASSSEELKLGLCDSQSVYTVLYLLFLNPALFANNTHKRSHQVHFF